MRYAFKVAYDGARYFGFARQPGLPTVEGELLKALKECGLCHDPAEARYQVAARTDRGVSAVGQVVALDVLKRPNINAINAHLPDDISVLSTTEVQPSFDPWRMALRKHYRYICVAPEGFNLTKARSAAKLLLGAHDFWSFCKHEQGRPTLGELGQVKISGKKVLTFDFVAPAFLWQQVRRMVGALLTVGVGKSALDDFKLMLEQYIDHLPRPASPDGLVLVHVKYRGISFKSQRISKRQANLLKRIQAKKSIYH
jgi:tRNA pseudouridine38-40 synthase